MKTKIILTTSLTFCLPFFAYVFIYPEYIDYTIRKDYVASLCLDLSEIKNISKIEFTIQDDIVHSFDNPQEIYNFLAKIEFEEDEVHETSICACMGDFQIHLYQAKQKIITMSSHHSISLRVSKNNTKHDFWGGNLDLTKQSQQHMFIITEKIKSLRPSYF